jgi:multidrug transporter EmrE-like cation transporter
VSSVIALIVAVGCNAVAQIVLKQGADRLKLVSDRSGLDKLVGVLTEAPQIPVGAALYGVSFILYVYVLSRRELSWAYPMAAVGYAAVLLLSWLVLKEEIGAVRLAGALVICVGVALVART